VSYAKAAHLVTAPKKANFEKALGKRQASILELLWSRGPQSVADLHRGLCEREDLAYTTVFTELSRMLKKDSSQKGTAAVRISTYDIEPRTPVMMS